MLRNRHWCENVILELRLTVVTVIILLTARPGRLLNFGDLESERLFDAGR